MKESFKDALKFITSGVRKESSPLEGKLKKKTMLTEKEKGKNGVLGTSRLEKMEGDEGRDGI